MPRLSARWRDWVWIEQAQTGWKGVFVMTGRLENKVAFNTGTGGGQGRAAAQIFAREGAKVVGCDLKKEGGEETVAMIEAAGGDSAFRAVDLGDGEQVKAWLEWGVAHYGQIDILYNNASAPKFAPIERMTWDEWRFTVRNELDLIYWACHHAFPMMKERGGVIINTASTAGVIGFANLGDFAHAATKGGVIALTRQLAAEGSPYSIRANSISPGLVETPATAAMMQDPQFRDAFVAQHMVKRAGRPEDIAYCALYLASDEASWVTGANFVIDGGLTAW